MRRERGRTEADYRDVTIVDTSPGIVAPVSPVLPRTAAPVLATLIIVMANRRALMGDILNRWWQNVLGVIGLVAVLALSVRLLMTLIGG